MWLRNWDNIQLIRLCGQVEQENTTEFGDNSRCLKDINGNIFTGNQADFFGGFDSASLDRDLTGGVNSSLICGLNVEGTWNTSNNLENFSKSNFFNKNSNNNTIIQTDKNILSQYANYNGIIMLVGTGALEGDTVASYDDYNFISEATMLSGSTYNKSKALKETSNNTWTIPISRTFTNPTDSSVTVKELGIFVLIGHNITNTDSKLFDSTMLNTVPIMVYHEALTEPVEIAPGQYQTFTIKIQLPTHG